MTIKLSRWLPALLLAAACGHPATSGGDALLQLPVPRQVHVDVHQVDGLGPVLTDGQGRTLYLFPPDARRDVTCTGACAGTWPPLVIGRHATPNAGPGVRQD